MTSVRQLRSSKRPEALADPYQPPSTSLTLALDQYATSMAGFLSLSDEMYLEILSHLPVYSFPAQFSRNDTEIYGQTRLTISALSRTCRKLRRIFLRYLWQRIEVYHRIDLGKGPLHKIQHANGKMRLLSGSRAYAMELVQQLETVTVRNPRLAEYVNVLDILVVDFSAKTILPELAWCIEQMPNLHTVHIQFALNEPQYNLIPQSFSAYTYPQIKNMFVTTNGSSLLHHCPNVQLVHPLWARWWDIENFLHGIIPACSFIETLGPIPVLGSTFSGSFESGTLGFYISEISQLKNLRDISFKLNELPTDSDMDKLWCIPNLKVIRLAFRLMIDLTKRDIDSWILNLKQVRNSWLIESCEGGRGEVMVIVNIKKE